MKVSRKSRVFTATQYNAAKGHPAVKVFPDGQIGCLKAEGYFPIDDGDYIIEYDGGVLDIVSPSDFEGQYDVHEEETAETTDKPEEDAVTEPVTDESSSETKEEPEE